MDPTMSKTRVTPIATVAALLLATGCNYSERDLDPTLKGFFADDAVGTPRATQFADAQAASGARADGTLFDTHFDGPRLNSLGEHKLSLMLADDDGVDPMVIFVDGDEKDARSQPRRSAVIDFLKARDLREDQLMIVFGDNPAARSPAAEHLKRQTRTENDTGGA